MSLINTRIGKRWGHKARWILGLWIGLELLSLPAAAMVAGNMGWLDFQRSAVTWIETDVPGEAMLVIRNDEPTQISVSGAIGSVQVITVAGVRCMHPGTAHPRIIHESSGAEVISLRFDPAHPPQIDVSRRFQVPVAPSCGTAA